MSCFFFHRNIVVLIIKLPHIAAYPVFVPDAIHVTTANVSDKAGAMEMIHKKQDSLLCVTAVLCDGGYVGAPFADSIRESIGAEVQIVKRNELHTFSVLPKRWIVERTFAWLEKCHRLWKNCERLLHSSLQMAVIAFISLLLKRF